MTDPHLPDATEPEELASAILDGEATDAEQARAGEPEVAAALAAFDRVSAAIGAAQPVDEPARERAIAAALGAWGTEATTGAPAPVDQLARRREARRGLRLVGVAAAVVGALAIGGLALRGGDDDSSGDVAASAPAPEVTTSAAEAGSATGGQATESAVALLDLGPYDDLDALVADAGRAATERALGEVVGSFEADGSGDAAADQSLEDAADPDATAGAPTAGATATSPACAPPPPPARAPITFSTATLDGRPVSVVVAGTGDDAVVQVVDVQTCELRYEGPAS